MITEAEAKTKWCPFVRYLATFRGADDRLEAAGCFNRGGADSGLEKAKCIASVCMSWRWEYTKTDPEDTYTDKARGYCGLAGRPK